MKVKLTFISVLNPNSNTNHSVFQFQNISFITLHIFSRYYMVGDHKIPSRLFSLNKVIYSYGDLREL